MVDRLLRRSEAPKRRNREGGSEWEPKKFFSKEIEAPTR
jgi:hypothetical protein